MFYANFQVHNFTVGHYETRFTCFKAQKHISDESCSSVFPHCLKNSILAHASLRHPPKYPVFSD